MTTINLQNNDEFSEALYKRMQSISPAIKGLELYEFRYALENVLPPGGWASVVIKPMAEVERLVSDSSFYTSIQLRPKQGSRMVMDPQVLSLLQMLFTGLVYGSYPAAWINEHFSFDVRGFYFIHRTRYYTEKVIQRMGGKPFLSFDPKQAAFENVQSVGYKAFKEANAEVDQAFINLTSTLVEKKGIPVIIAIAGQTAAGKTEIVERLQSAFRNCGKSLATVEIDHFLTDRDYREDKGIDSLGKEALHYDMLLGCIKDLYAGKAVSTPQYDFVQATSSHTIEGDLKAGCQPLRIEPAEIIFMEGNFPFLLPEIAHLIGIKAMYLTDDAVRLKRKWKRDMDYRKKYELYYFLNRYFREQFLMAEQVYIPQMEICDLIVDTTQAEIWVSDEVKARL